MAFWALKASKSGVSLIRPKVETNASRFTAISISTITLHHHRFPHSAAALETNHSSRSQHTSRSCCHRSLRRLLDAGPLLAALRFRGRYEIISKVGRTQTHDSRRIIRIRWDPSNMKKKPVAHTDVKSFLWH